MSEHGRGTLEEGARPAIQVAIAVLRRGGEVLVRRRRPEEALPGVWEFPGGKIGEGETPAAAARREVLEEMGLDLVPSALALRETIEHEYPGTRVRLFVFEGVCAESPAPSDGASWAWLAPSELARRPIPEANRGLVARLAAEGVSRNLGES